MCHPPTDCLPAFARNSKSKSNANPNAKSNATDIGATEIPQSLAALFAASMDIAFVEISRYRFLKSCQCS